MKCCTKCSETKPVDAFSKSRAQCKECQKAYHQAYYAANRERKKAYLREWREENREKISSYNKMWNAENPEKRTTHTKSWRGENPAKVTASVAKRRAAKLQRTPAWLTDFDKEMIDWTYHCAKVATEKFGGAYHVDHVIPLQGENVSGLHVPGNLQVISATENLSKGASYHG